MGSREASVPLPSMKDGTALPASRRIAPWVSVAILVGLVLVWEVAVREGWISGLFFPAPTAIGEDFIKLLLHGNLIEDTGWTVLRLVVGFLIGGIPALLLGWLMG